MSHKILNAHFFILAITWTFLIEGEQVRIFLILHKFNGMLKNIPIPNWGKPTNITFLPLKNIDTRSNKILSIPLFWNSM